MLHPGGGVGGPHQAVHGAHHPLEDPTVVSLLSSLVPHFIMLASPGTSTTLTSFSETYVLEIPKLVGSKVCVTAYDA